MSFFQRPIITGNWGTPIDVDGFVFKAFQKNDKEVEIKIYKKRLLIDSDIDNITTTNHDFYNIFVPNLNVNKTPLVLHVNTVTHIKGPILGPMYASKEIPGNWSCDPADKANVLASMPATSEINSGGKRHKRSGHKKRKSQKKHGSHKKHRSHKKSHRRRHWIY